MEVINLWRNPYFSKEMTDESDDEVYEEKPVNSDESQFNTPAHYWVPRILVATDMTAGFASGMTIKFFPLFFKEESLMSPIEVSFVAFSAYFCTSFLSYLGRKYIHKNR